MKRAGISPFPARRHLGSPINASLAPQSTCTIWGRLLLDGRVDDMIVSGGENVYPGPVAAAITSHPDVADAVLRPVPDEEFGQRLLATVEVRTDRTLTEASLRKWLRHRLTRAELPRDIVIVTTLPRSATGKPTRQG
ncbi:AMP-binding enzyme [Micromonospora chersina]|uniref:AMP-binding enzyme n=1 Tax=Micromonospora chersina TaxID=47854 RepID=UPI0033F0CB6A